MKLNEFRAAMHKTKQPKLSESKFSSYSVLTLRRAQAH